jgi:hypothetical protein
MPLIRSKGNIAAPKNGKVYTHLTRYYVRNDAKISIMFTKVGVRSSKSLAADRCLKIGYLLFAFKIV